jgi:class 3 adenylate cyclase
MGALADAVRAELARGFAWVAPLSVLCVALFILATHAVGIPAAIENLFVGLILEEIYGAPAEPLRRPPMADATELIFLAVAGVAMVVMFAQRSVVAAATALAGALSGASLFAWGMAMRWGALFDVFTVAVALICVFFAGFAADRSLKKEDRARLRALAAQFSPPAFAALARFTLAPARRDITYLVCRIRDFAARADVEDPGHLVALNSLMLHPLEHLVHAHRGTIDRLTPGGITCIFGAPLADRDAEMSACACALAMTDAVAQLNRTLAAENASFGAVSIGIDSGEALVGDFGSYAVPRYGVAGRMIDATLDVERIAAQYGVAIAIGEGTRTRAERQFAFLELDLVPRGGGAPLAIYSLLGPQATRASPKFRALQAFHHRIFQAYRARDWARARALIVQCRALSGANAKLYDFYLDRIGHYERHPPSDGWDGTFRRASA